ncbi:hypothetical protein [Luteimonas sp. gir]
MTQRSTRMQLPARTATGDRAVMFAATTALLIAVLLITVQTGAGTGFV